MLTLVENATSYRAEDPVVAHKLRDLQNDHKILDEKITYYSNSSSCDQLTLQGMKRKKLLLKDQISYYEDLLEPDISA